jgi:hypothetical protein
VTDTLAPSLGQLGWSPWSADPSNHGLVAWDYDPILAQVGSTALTSGTLQVVAVFQPQIAPISGVALRVSTAGVTLTAAQNLIGVYGYSGSNLTLIGSSADQSGVWTSTGNKSALISPAATGLNGVAPGVMFVVILSVGTTPPIFQGLVPTAIANIGQLSPRFAAGAAAQTALPATITQASLVGNTIAPWVGLF